MPVVHFGFWTEVLDKWFDEGHLSKDELAQAKQGDGTPGEDLLARKLGFDCNYHSALYPNTGLMPPFDEKVIDVMPDGTRMVMNSMGVTYLQKDGAGSIPAEVDHALKGRREWDELFLPRLQFSPDRVDNALVKCGNEMTSFDAGGLEHLKSNESGDHMILHCGSLYGKLRDYLGMENLCYLAVDDEDLLIEMIDVIADLCYNSVKYVLESGAKIEIAHFWEDICFKNGPLVNPGFFAEKVGPHYRRITDLLRTYDINLVSLDCDGLIDKLIPVWIENGVNVMFPIEVGTWGASIKPWREMYGKSVRGVGGVMKHIFSEDYSSIDAEIERLKPLVGLGGYIPCPDHRIPSDAKWENVQYYCEQMREALS